MNVLFAFGFGMPGPMEMLIIGGIAVLLFGKRLPEVVRSLGKGIVEFKKGIGGIEDEINSATSSSASSHSSSTQANDHEETAAPKFEPPASEPKAEAAETSTAADSHGDEAETKSS
jgi:sec-independent protein translocase protein TatA